MNSFYSQDELLKLGLCSVGKQVLISRKTSLYGAENITVGNHVRIDDFCILSGNLTLGSSIHIAAYSALYGGEGGIAVGDYANISSKNAIYALSDDYSGEAMTNPMVPVRYRKVDDRPVRIGRHVILGSGCVVLPGVTLHEGCAVGAMSLVRADCEAFTVYAGIPARKIKQRSRNLLELERQMREDAHA